MAPAETHCIVRALRCADAWHTAAAPRRRHGCPALPLPLSGSEAHPLHTHTSPWVGKEITGTVVEQGGARKLSPERARPHGGGG